MRQGQAMFANFICKFGNENLADYLHEIVLPAFTDDTLVRTRRLASFHLLDVELLNFAPDNSEPAIAGRFIKDTALRRTQFLDETGHLVQSEAKLPSSPSAFFVLLLTDHRLIYYAESPFAPDISSFEANMTRFLSRKYHAYINRLYEEVRERVHLGEDAVRVTKKALYATIIHPTLNIVPIPSDADIAELVARYAVLKRIDVIVHKRNDEIDASELMEHIDAYNERLSGEVTRLTTSDSSGLDKDGAVETLREIGPGGNQSVKLTGQDGQGNQLTVNNEDFSVKADIPHLPNETDERAAGLYRKMNELIATGTLRRPAILPQIKQRIMDMMLNLV